MLEQFKLSFDLSVKNYKKDHKSLHWDNFYKDKLLNINIKDLNDFRNNHLSDGMDNVRFNQGYSELRLNQFNDFLKKNNERIDSYYKFFPKKNIGNAPNQIKTDWGFVDYMLIESLMFYIELEKYVFKNNEINIICEIGGGFGSLARIIIPQKKVKYFLIDLPETNLISSFFLNQHFKEKKIFSYQNVINDKINAEDIKDYDIIIIPPWVKFENIKIDLFINTRSMMEMNFSIVKDYFKFIKKNISNQGFFYNCNRYYKDTVGHPVKLHEYPYDNFWEVINSEPTWCQRRLHTLITRRTSNELNQIKKTMLQIKVLSKNHTPHYLQNFKVINKIIKFYKKKFK